MAVKKTIDINKFVLEKLKNKSISTDTIIRDPNTSYGWDLRALIKEFIKGKFKHEDQKKIINPSHKNKKLYDPYKPEIKKLFINAFIKVPTIHGAITYLVKRDKKGNYPFKKLSKILRTLEGVNPVKAEKKALTFQISHIFGKLEDIKNYFRDENFFHITKLNSHKKLDSDDIEILEDLIRMKILTKEEIDTFKNKSLKL